MLQDIISFFWVYALTSAIMSEEVLQCRNKVRDGKGGNILQKHCQTNQRSSKEQWHLVHPFFSVSNCWGHYYNAKISSTAQPTIDLRGKETSCFDQCVWVYIYTRMCGQVCVWERVYKKEQDYGLILCRRFVCWCYWHHTEGKNHYSSKEQLCINWWPCTTLKSAQFECCTHKHLNRMKN